MLLIIAFPQNQFKAKKPYLSMFVQYCTNFFRKHVILLTWVKPCVYIGTKRKFQFFAEINKIKIFSLPGKKTGPAARPPFREMGGWAFEFDGRAENFWDRRPNRSQRVVRRKGFPVI